MLVKEYRATAAQTACNSNLHFVLCIFKSPFGLEKRVGYFEDAQEAIAFSIVLLKTYSKLGVPFELSSDIIDINYRTQSFFDACEV